MALFTDLAIISSLLPLSLWLKVTVSFLFEIAINISPILYSLDGIGPASPRIAKEIEELALNDTYFREKNLYPNVDFYSGILLKALNIPTTMFTPIFAVGRTVGWLSQWKEMIEDEEFKITRPRQLFTGDRDKSYKKVPDREKKSIFNLLWLKKTFLNNQ